MENNLAHMFKQVRVEKKFDESMCSYTSFRIGGNADMIIYPEQIEEVKEILLLCLRQEIPFFVLGYGTNLLVRDKGIRGVVISMSKGFEYIEMIKITNKIVHLVVGAGLKLSRLIKFCLENSLGGIECLSGIPGSIGGAITMNAGTAKGEIGDSIRSVRIMDEKGKVTLLESKQAGFGYRESNIPKGSVIIDAEFVFKKTVKKKARNKIAENLRARKKSQPLSLHCAGSIFKNPDGLKAYKIIDEIGLRGESVGDACVSKKHANFIINKGNARASDVTALINLIRKKARSLKGVSLEPEIILVGERV